MPPFAKSENLIRACEGTCGRMTRPSKVTSAMAAAQGFPDTVSRYDGKRCGVCWKALPENAPSPEEQVMIEARAARKEQLAAERVAAAAKVREQYEAQRARRATSRVKRVSLGQTGVRI